MNKLILAAAAATLIAPAAHALTIDQTDTQSFGFAPTELDTTLSFAGYTGTETITSVTLTLFGEIDGTISLTNGAATAQNVQAASNSAFFFSSSDVGLPPVPQVTATGGTGFINILAGQTETVDVDGSDSTATTFGGGDVAQFLSPFDIDLETLTGFSSSGGGGQLSSDQDTQAFAEVTVEYGFEPIVPPLTSVPLPAAAWMLLAGLGALLAFRRSAKV